MSSKMRIESLANHPDYLDPLATWYHQAFSHLTGDLTIEQRRRNLESHIGSHSLPVSFVAFNRYRLLGGICLVEHDIDGYPTYRPWLSRIYVDEASRGQSVATRLIRHAIAHVRTLGFGNLYLLTEHRQAFFSGVGFMEIDKSCLNGYEVSVMALDLAETTRTSSN